MCMLCRVHDLSHFPIVWYCSVQLAINTRDVKRNSIEFNAAFKPTRLYCFKQFSPSKTIYCTVFFCLMQHGVPMWNGKLHTQYITINFIFLMSMCTHTLNFNNLFIVLNSHSLLSMWPFVFFSLDLWLCIKCVSFISYRSLTRFLFPLLLIFFTLHGNNAQTFEFIWKRSQYMMHALFFFFFDLSTSAILVWIRIQWKESHTSNCKTTDYKFFIRKW